jgi:hypothetical protein
MAQHNTNLKASTNSFNDLMQQGFGIVTVMDAYVCDALPVQKLKKLTAYDIVSKFKNPTVGGTVTFEQKDDVPAATSKVRCKLDTLKIANVTQEGPTKTVTGGQFSNPLIKFGKSARLEMQDALGNAEAVEQLCGGFQEWNDGKDGSPIVGLHFGEDFQGPKMIIGDSFFINRKNGQQVKVKIVFHQFLPDSIFNLTQDAEGDASVFDMNGDLLTTVIKVDDGKTHGVFYSIVDPNEGGTN